MSFKLSSAHLFCVYSILAVTSGHIPIHVSTPSNKIEQYCELADSCVHDTIPVCGQMEKEKRTFMDICDMLEYVCDHNKIYTHVDDLEGCPVFKKKRN